MSSSPSTFDTIRIGFYNELTSALNLPTHRQFQMLQPAAPIPANSDVQITNFFNLIPAETLSTNAVPVIGNQFYSNFSGLLSALVGVTNTFSQDVGTVCEAAWQKYVGGLVPTPQFKQWPQLFQQWAMMNGYSSVANKGANDLSQALLDPVTAAQFEMDAATGPSWDQGYAALVAQLAVAPGLEFLAASSTWSTSSSETWANSSQDAVFGLWSTDSSSSQESSQFAASDITITGSFAHVTTFMAVPGAWYSSAAMGLAYSHETGSPWNPGSDIDWQNTFADPGGNLARFTNSLIVVSGMTITVTSSAVFSAESQSLITSNQSAGLWPFYNESSSSGTSSSAAFNAAGNMTITITSPGDTPIVLGMNVVPVSAYVGSAVEGARMHAAALAAAQAPQSLAAEQPAILIATPA